MAQIPENKRQRPALIENSCGLAPYAVLCPPQGGRYEGNGVLTCMAGATIFTGDRGWE